MRTCVGARIEMLQKMNEALVALMIEQWLSKFQRQAFPACQQT